MKLLHRLPPLNALRAFEVVARHLSFARAAEELHVTKAAVAQQVRALEQDVGARLVERNGRGLRLTNWARPEQERSPKDWRSSPRPRAPCARVTGAAFW